MKEIKIQLTLDEVNLALEAIGELPYARVYKLVEKIQAQVLQQFDNDKSLGKDNKS